MPFNIQVAIIIITIIINLNEQTICTQQSIHPSISIRIENNNKFSSFVRVVYHYAAANHYVQHFAKGTTTLQDYGFVIGYKMADTGGNFDQISCFALFVLYETVVLEW